LVNVNNWLGEHQSSFLPPVCNKLMHEKQLKVFFVGGPNQRKDFHLEQGEEFFYMKKGNMELIVQEQGRFRSIFINEGQVFLLPGKIPHSPQRKENTIGLVVERERSRNELDCLRYFVDGTTDTLFERWFYCDDLGAQLGPVIKEFFASNEYRTGRPIDGSSQLKPPPYQPDAVRSAGAAFSLQRWLQCHSQEIDEKGCKRLFDGDFESDIVVYGRGTSHLSPAGGEVWLWQLRGVSTVNVGGNLIVLKVDDTLLVPADKSFSLQRDEESFILSIAMATPHLKPSN